MSEFEIKPASRTGVKPLVGMYGKSGSGKTMSALLFARGLAGPNGKICLLDSESGRGSLFADIIPGGYSVIEIGPPFSPERYQEAFEVAEKSADVVVIDSLSHEHTGEGGVLDMQEAELDRMAGDNWQKREACKMAAWIKPKMAHKKFLGRILRCRCALICCLRGEEKTHITKDQGKSKVITDEFSSPIFDPRFLFELLVNFETVQIEGKGGFVIPRKITHPAIEALLPKRDERIGVKHGEAMAAWAKSPGPIGSAQTTTPATSTTTAPAAPKQTPAMLDLKKRLAAKAKGPFELPDDPRSDEYRTKWEAFTDWLMQNEIITRELKTLSEDELRAVVETVEAKTDEELRDRF